MTGRSRFGGMWNQPTVWLYYGTLWPGVLESGFHTKNRTPAPESLLHYLSTSTPINQKRDLNAVIAQTLCFWYFQRSLNWLFRNVILHPTLPSHNRFDTYVRQTERKWVFSCCMKVYGGRLVSVRTIESWHYQAKWRLRDEVILFEYLQRHANRPSLQRTALNTAMYVSLSPLPYHPCPFRLTYSRLKV